MGADFMVGVFLFGAFCLLVLALIGVVELLRGSRDKGEFFFSLALIIMQVAFMIMYVLCAIAMAQEMGWF